jgi:hypothetical protein
MMKKPREPGLLLASLNGPRVEATTGFEPVIRVLQTLALPLGHVASIQIERATRLELVTFSLARRCSTN